MSTRLSNTSYPGEGRGSTRTPQPDCRKRSAAAPSTAACHDQVDSGKGDPRTAASASVATGITRGYPVGTRRTAASDNDSIGLAWRDCYHCSNVTAAPTLTAQCHTCRGTVVAATSASTAAGSPGFDHKMCHPSGSNPIARLHELCDAVDPAGPAAFQLSAVVPDGHLCAESMTRSVCGDLDA
jgi:hypothetical protein